jgi:hypothetical protein
MDYVKKYFSNDFFKHVHISTKLAYRQLQAFQSKAEFQKLHKPILILRPRIEINDDSKWFYGSTMMNRVYNAKNPMEFANRVDLINDRQRGLSFQFMWNRSKIYYDIIIIVDSYNEQLNIANYLNNMIVPNTPFFIETALESFIPRNMIYTIADYLKIDREDKSAILNYLNANGNTPFTYKFKDGSGNDEFFSLYGTRIEAITSDLSIDDGSEKGLTTDTYTISFTLSMEFNAMGAYFLSLRDNKPNYITCPPGSDIGKKDVLVPLFSIPLYHGLQDIPDGWRIIHTPSLMITDNCRDVTDISAVVDNTLIEVIKYQREMHLDQSLFVKFRLFGGYRELVYGKDFEVDLRNLKEPKLIVHNGKPRMTYRLFVIVNNAYIHSITSDIVAFNNEK